MAPNPKSPRWPRRKASDSKAMPEVREDPRYREVEYDGLKWIHLEDPQLPEQRFLGENFPFHPLDLEDVLSKTQRPKVDEYPDYLFIVLHFPLWDRKTERLSTGEIDIFLGSDYIITITDSRLRALEEMFLSTVDNEELKTKRMGAGSGYLLYRIVDMLFDRCFPMLSKIGHKLDILEEKIFLDEGDAVVRDISQVKQEIITFRKTMRPQRTVIKDLERTKRRFLPEDIELDYYFEDTQDAAERIWDLLENYKEVVTALHETNESVINHRVNAALKALTALSVIVLPLTLIASVWGMNVELPGQNSEHIFILIMMSMVGLFALLIAFFKRKGLL